MRIIMWVTVVFLTMASYNCGSDECYEYYEGEYYDDESHHEGGEVEGYAEQEGYEQEGHEIEGHDNGGGSGCAGHQGSCSGGMKILRVNSGWQFVGAVAQRAGNGWPAANWVGFETQCLQWCPSAGEVAGFNVQAVPPRSDCGGNTGRNCSWALEGRINDPQVHWCKTVAEDTSMFTGCRPEEAGCRVDCAPSFDPDYLCQ